MVPYNYLTNSSATVLSDAHVALARRAAGEGVAMYQVRHAHRHPLSIAAAAVSHNTLLTTNQNKNNALPLDRSTIKSIAVVGPGAAQTTLLQGNYAVTPTVGCGVYLAHLIALTHALWEEPS